MLIVFWLTFCTAYITAACDVFLETFSQTQILLPITPAHKMPARTKPHYDETLTRVGSSESCFSSQASSDLELFDVFFTKPHLQFLNRQFQFLEAQDILRWCVTTIPHLYQTTAFGLTGLVTLDMLSKMNIPRPQTVDLIFLDTLHHFPETLALVERVRQRYPNVNVHVYRPQGLEDALAFSDRYGDRLWESDEKLYDWVAKVEPMQRAYRELTVDAVLTGRRRSQGGKRGDLDIIEVDEAGLIKINPLANWTFKQVQEYIKDNNVPYNELLDRGYKSVGDWHSTQPVQDGEDERSGRWKGQEKTECGIHNPRSKFAQYLKAQQEKEHREKMEQVIGEVSIVS